MPNELTLTPAERAAIRARCDGAVDQPFLFDGGHEVSVFHAYALTDVQRLLAALDGCDCELAQLRSDYNSWVDNATQWHTEALRMTAYAKLQKQRIAELEYERDGWIEIRNRDLLALKAAEARVEELAMWVAELQRWTQELTTIVIQDAPEAEIQPNVDSTGG